MTTPVEVWLPAFAKILPEKIVPEVIFSDVEDWRVPGKRWCALCETFVPFHERETHAREHDRERREFKQKAARLRRESDRASGAEVQDPPSAPDGRPIRPRKEVKKMATTTTKKRATLPDAREKALVSSVEKTFGSRSKDFQKGAVIYGRKLLKLDSGLRSSRPPVPPALQSDDREKTRETCAAVAKALGLDPGKLGLLKAATPAEDLNDRVVEAKAKAKPDPKPKSASRKKTAAAKKG